MKEFKLPPGPAVGMLLDAIREAQATGQIATRQEALSLAKGLIKDNHLDLTETE